MTMGNIYKITNSVNDKIYIGQTKFSIETRWKGHLSHIEKRNQAIYLAMRKYGVENFKIELIEEVLLDKLDEREIYWIDALQSLSPNGYNLLKGGSFSYCAPMSMPELVKKVCGRLSGDKNPAKRPEVRAKIRMAALGRKASLETKQKMSVNNGRYWATHPIPEHVKNNIRKYHENDHNGSLNPNAKAVARLDKETNEILDTYGAFSEAIQWIKENTDCVKASFTNISHCIRGKQKTAFGFKWKLI